MKIENFEDFTIDRFEGVNLSGEELFNFITEYKSYYDVANMDYVVKVKLWNGVEIRREEKVESISKMGVALTNINLEIMGEITNILHILKKDSEYHGECPNLKEWAKHAEKYQEKFKYYEVGKKFRR
jgi:hypothetical protein